MENNTSFLKLDKKAKSLWLIRQLIFIIIFIAIAVSIIASEDKEYRLATGLGIGVPLCILSIWMIIFPFLKYNRYSYVYTEDRVLIRFGVIFKHRIVIPVVQIQDLHIIQGPIMTLFKLSSVNISTAGSNFVLSGLSNEDANQMVKDLESKLNIRLEAIKNEEI